MNNTQFILLMIWVCFASAYIGYEIGGVLLDFLGGVTIPAGFLMVGD